MILSRRASVFLLLFAVWSWVIWPNFLVNLWGGDRSWDAAGNPTTYFLVHALLAVVSLILGTAIGVLGWRGFAASRRTRSAAHQDGSD
ncbi:hypothetical protein EV191_109148 [Tamaricihabitans halophyticus]|uniref:Integral membrane protein n=1 Tax=Tamaricihabitans halophyticus TaxID=1262583 RepID=A0A4V2STA2_9PSEU|nr:hypothetical protein [Tamaricihabitans halophyticus]TCP49326.1 hypothetical protein EV191_109148 [Tamaricihabitans halophyticus]